jgi:hypothetical protein
MFIPLMQMSWRLSAPLVPIMGVKVMSYLAYYVIRKILSVLKDIGKEREENGKSKLAKVRIYVLLHHWCIKKLILE